MKLDDVDSNPRSIERGLGSDDIEEATKKKPAQPKSVLKVGEAEMDIKCLNDGKIMDTEPVSNVEYY